MGRPCTICASIDNTRIASEMIAAGASDQAIADRLGGMSRMAVHRHRHSHVVLPAPALAAAAARARVAQVPPSSRPAAVARPVANRPAPAALASPSPDAQDIVNAALGAPRQAEKLVRIEDRLERMATLAEQSGSPGQVATIATAQLRAVETGAKLAGVGGFAPQKVQGDGGGPPCMVTIVIGGQEPIRIAATPLLNMTSLPPDSAMSDGAEGAAVVENTGASPTADDFARLCAAFSSDRGRHDVPAPQPAPAPAASAGNDDDEAAAAAAVRPPGWGRAAYDRMLREGAAKTSGDPRDR